MNNKLNISILSAIILSFTSCNDVPLDKEESIPVASKSEVTFGIDRNSPLFNLGTHTKTVEEVKSLDSFLVIATTGSSGSEDNAWDETRFSKEGGTEEFKGSKYWPTENPGYHFYSSNESMNFSRQGCSLTASGDKDVVCAYIENPSYKNVNNLMFDHIYSRVGKFVMNTQEGYEITVISATLLCPVSGTYNIRLGNGKTDGSGWTPGESGMRTLLEENDLYVVPGAYELTVTYTLKKGAWEKNFTKKADITLVKGKVCNITGNAVGGDAAEIKVNVSVEPWKYGEVTAQWK